MRRIIVWSATGVLGLLWMARRAWNDWQWQQLQRRYPYAIRPTIQPFPILLFNICYAIYSNIIQGVLFQLVVVSFWQVVRRGWHWIWTRTRYLVHHHDDRHIIITGQQQQEQHPTNSHDPSKAKNASVADYFMLRQHRELDEAYQLVPDDTDSMQVLVPLDNTPPCIPRSDHHNNGRRHPKHSLIALKHTMRYDETKEKDHTGIRPSSVLRRNTKTHRSRIARPTKSVAFSTDASGAVTTTEHRYDPTSAHDKENSKLATPQPRSITLLGHRQIARLQNDMLIKHREVLTRKRTVPPASDTVRGPSGRISLAKFKRRPLSVATPKRKQQDQLQRDLARFDDKRRRVNIQLSFAVSKPNGDSSSCVLQNESSSMKATNADSVSFSAAASPPPTASVASTPSAGFSVPFQATPLPDTQGFTRPLQPTPHPKKDDQPVVAFETVTSNVSTPEVQAKADATIATPVPNKGKKSVSFGAALAVDSAATFKSTLESSMPTPSGAYPAAAALASTPSIHFSSTHTPHNTPASIFGSSGATTTTPTPNQPLTALPVSFGIAPAPSFQFGSTAANTPKPGPVSTTATTTAMAVTKSDSFDAAANSINPFGNNGVSSSFGSQSQASTTFGAGHGNENAPAPHAELESSNSFGTTNTPSQSAATSLFGSAATPIATVSLGQSGTQVNATTALGGNSVSSFGGETQCNSFVGSRGTGTQTNSSNPFEAVSYNSKSAQIGGVGTAPEPSFGGSGSRRFGNTGAAMTTSASFGGVATQNVTNPFGNPSLNSFGSSATGFLSGDIPSNVGATGTNKARPRQLRRMKR